MKPGARVTLLARAGQDDPAVLSDDVTVVRLAEETVTLSVEPRLVRRVVGAAQRGDLYITVPGPQASPIPAG